MEVPSGSSTLPVSEPVSTLGPVDGTVYGSDRGPYTRRVCTDSQYGPYYGFDPLDRREETSPYT